ncbi:MAG: hypothetical protein V2I33_01170 [Kangiellaceae bacterium]|jgi:hypothetical protein|nr:hypothetical protein [Kangiellaceae bacterium]
MNKEMLEKINLQLSDDLSSKKRNIALATSVLFLIMGIFYCYLYFEAKQRSVDMLNYDESIVLLSLHYVPYFVFGMFLIVWGVKGIISCFETPAFELALKHLIEKELENCSSSPDKDSSGE